MEMKMKMKMKIIIVIQVNFKIWNKSNKINYKYL